MKLKFLLLLIQSLRWRQRLKLRRLKWPNRKRLLQAMCQQILG